MRPSRDWTDIRWSEVAPTEPARWIAVLPLAATEQHGPHLPLETDVLIAEAYLARVRELAPENLPVTFLGVERIGISTEHIDYPGTQTLPTEAALKRWTGIGEDVARAGSIARNAATKPAVNTRRKSPARMIGLRRSFWPMMEAPVKTIRGREAGRPRVPLAATN